MPDDLFRRLVLGRQAGAIVVVPWQDQWKTIEVQHSFESKKDSKILRFLVPQTASSCRGSYGLPGRNSSGFKLAAHRVVFRGAMRA